MHTSWAGSESWKVRADGGGYRYALCPKPKTYPTKRYMDLSESCFQETTLKFGIPDRPLFLKSKSSAQFS